MKLSTSSKSRPYVLENPWNKFTVLLKNDLLAVNDIILERMQSEITLIPQLAGHLIAAGGKRIRPLLALSSAAIFGYQGTRHHKISACVEFIHTATLLHDDVVDDSVRRRGRASANALFGNEAAVLVGDFLFSRSFELIVEDGSLDVLRILSKASSVIAEGEVLQLSTANDLETTGEQYLKVVRSKTAELFASACEVGAVVAGGSPSECQAIRDYGMNLGIAFQISDDVLDYSSSEKSLGKSVGDDFKEGKMTIPVIRALAGADEDEMDFWKRCMTDIRQQDGDFQKACTFLEKHDALKSSLKEAEHYAELGKKALAGVPDNPLRKHLSDLIVFVIKRDY